MQFLKRVIAVAIICPVISFAQSLPYPSVISKTLRISLKDNLSSSETVIQFKKGYSSLYDIADGDAPSSGGKAILLTSLTSDAKSMGINFMPDLSEVPEVRLSVNAASSKKVILSFPELPFVENYHFILKDRYQNTEVAILRNTTYEFGIDKSVKATYGADRFIIVVRKAIDIIDDKVEIEKPTNMLGSTPIVYPNPATTVLHVSSTDTSSLDALIYNTSGILVQKSKIADGDLSIDISNLKTQTYVIVLKDSQSQSRLLVSKFLKQP